MTTEAHDINFDRVPPVYKSRYDALMEEGRQIIRTDDVRFLRDMRELRKRIIEDGQDTEQIDEIVTTLVDRLAG